MPDLLDDIDRFLIDEDKKYCSIECEEKANFLAAKRYRLSMKNKNNIISLNDYKSNKKGSFSKEFLERSLTGNKNSGHHDSMEEDNFIDLI